MASRQQWFIGGGVVVGIILLVAARNDSNPLGSSVTGSGGARPCTVTVTADLLNVRSSPDSDAFVVQTYARGAVMSADRTIRNGFRQLDPGRWAAQEYLEPTPGSDCG